ncbi:CAP domain-containing protein [Patulibacter defluvii]|uniref:CAP domain-containing protein n=1 Tax=Patulibacter defluvii TaxID=3095358 RepID=UPI002A75BB7B|nr:hypothetical protein [Patulibacter sp. DM4]
MTAHAGRFSLRGRGGRGAIALLATLLAIALPAGTAAADPSPARFLAACPGADQPQRAAKPAERLLRCLVDEARRDAHRPALRSNRKLVGVARRQVDRSVAAGRLDHGIGGSFDQRLRRAGYVRRGHRWGGGEALGAGRGGNATPLATILRWLASHAGHREVVLGRSARDVGLAWSGKGSSGFGGSGAGATWALVTAWHR